MRLSALLVPISIAAAVGCGSSGGSATDSGMTGGPDGSTTATDGGGTVTDAAPPDAAPPNTTTMRIVTSAYTLTAGQEFYNCQRITIPNDLYILKVTPVSTGGGVHHEVFAIDPTKAKPDGLETHCQAIGPSWKPLFASGLNSPSLSMPAGVALKVSAGDQVVLNVHLFNASGATISGTASLDVLVTTADPSGFDLAGVPFVGPVPAGANVPSSAVINSSCTVNKATKFFAVFPHMHMTGHHIKITATTQAGTQTVWDQDYDFMDQRFGTFPEVQLAAGDKINVTCTYSVGGTPLGDSSTDEMCFAISYVHPAVATSFGTPFCIN